MIYRILAACLGVLLWAGVAHAQIPGGCTVATGSAIGCVKPDGTTITISSGTITALGGAATSISVGVTTVGSGTNAYLLYNNSGTLGNEAFSSACTNATTSTLGCVKADGTTISVSAGVISVIGGGGLTIGTTTITSGAANGVLYQNVSGSTLNYIATANNEVLGTNGSGVPAYTTTLPSAVTASSLTSVGTLTSLTISGNLTTNITGGGTVCVQASNAGVLSGTGSACGSGGGGSGITGITVGTTTISAGAANGLLYQNVSGSTVNYVATANNEVLGTNGAGVPAYTTTLPSAVTASSLTSVGTLTSLTVSGNITSNITGGGTVCVQASNTGVLSGTGSGCGAGGSGITGITVGTTTISAGAANGLLYQNVSGSTVNYVATANNEVLGTNGSGVPAYTTTLPSAVTASSLTSVGTIGTGTWQGTVVGATYGGTGINNGSNTLTLGNALTFASLTAANDVLYVSSSGNVGQETFASACSNATAAAFGCVKVDNLTVTAAAGVISSEGVNLYVANAGSTGTTVNKLAKLTGAPSTAVITATTDSPNPTAIGLVTAGAGTSGTATIQRSGLASCVFDGVTTAGDLVGLSTTTAGDCHDLGASPGQGQIVGTVGETHASGGTYGILLNIPTTAAIPGPGANQILTSNASSVASWNSVGSGLSLSGGVLSATGSGITGITVNTTTISGGATTQLLYNNAGTVGNETFASACTAATAAALGCVEVDNTTTTAAAGVISTQGANYYIPNAGSTGTTTSKLVKLTGATAVITATSDTTNPLPVAMGICTANCTTSGVATVQYSGVATCVFDGATTAGHPVGLSSTTAGDCHDNGTSTPSAGQVIGTVVGTIGSAGNAPVTLNLPPNGPMVTPQAIPIGWIAGVTPNAGIVATMYQNATILAITGRVETAVGSAATVSVNKAASGTACSAGTTLHSGSFNANGTATTNQNLTVTTTTLRAGDTLCLQSTGTYYGNSADGGITIWYTTP